MVGKAPRRHAAAVTDELLPGVFQGAAPAGLGAVKPGGGTDRRLTVCGDRLGARGRHPLRGVRLGHFTPPSSGGLHHLPDPVAAPTKPGARHLSVRNSGAPAADDGKFQIACGVRLIMLTEPHDGAERCAQFAELCRAFGHDLFWPHYRGSRSTLRLAVGTVTTAPHQVNAVRTAPGRARTRVAEQATHARQA
jgi:hypothetical protein